MQPADFLPAAHAPALTPMQPQPPHEHKNDATPAASPAVTAADVQSKEMLEYALLEPYLQRAEAHAPPLLSMRATADASAAAAAASDSSDSDGDSIINDDSPQQQHASSSAAPPLFHAPNGRSYAFAPALDLKAEHDPTQTQQQQQAWHDGLPLAPKIVLKDVAYVRVRRDAQRQWLQSQRGS